MIRDLWLGLVSEKPWEKKVFRVLKFRFLVIWESEEIINLVVKITFLFCF